MARCPFAEWNPTGTTPGGWIKPRVAILHVIDGEGDARPHSGLEWHFEIRYDGRIQQQVDTSQRADANLYANDFAISIETEGLAAGQWTDAQIGSILRLLRWLHEVHDIPLRVVDKWDGAGIGFHTIWGAPSKWTPVAKSCPGPNRKTQFWQLIVPALAEGDDMPTAEEVARATVDLLNAEGTAYGTTGYGATVKLAVDLGRQAVVKLDQLLGRSGDVDVPALASALAAELGDDLARELGEALVRGAA